MPKPGTWLAAIAIVLGITTLAPTLQAQPYRPGDGPGGGPSGGRWVELGCVDVGRRPDFDAIQVGRGERRYRAIALSVSGRDVHIEDLRVIYGNGQPDQLPIRADLRAGTRSNPIDLQGRDRVIRRIEIVAQRDNLNQGRGRARLCIAGLTEEGPSQSSQGGRWEALGCQQVGMALDRDAIRVGRHEGQFRAIRLEVGGNDVFVENLTVVYGNGERDQIAVRAGIRRGTQTAPLDLRGERRAIERIELIYRAVPNNRGTARVCASGLA